MSPTSDTENVRVALPNGATMRVESVNLGGRQKVGAMDIVPFDGVTGAVEGLAGTLLEGLRKVQPRKTTIEFGVEIGIESGKLTALLCKGTGRANLKIVLEWEAGVEADGQAG